MITLPTNKKVNRSLQSFVGDEKDPSHYQCEAAWAFMFHWNGDGELRNQEPRLDFMRMTGMGLFESRDTSGA